MKLLLSCSGGMSSSLIAEGLENEAQKRGLKDVKVDAVGADEVADYLNDDKYDAVLLAPQAVYRKDSIAAEAKDHSIPFILIPRNLYSPLGSSKLFDIVKQKLAE